MSTPLVSQLHTSLGQNNSLHILKTLSSDPLKVSSEHPRFPTKDMRKVWQRRVHASSLVIDLFAKRLKFLALFMRVLNTLSVMCFFPKTSLGRVTAYSY